MATPRSSKVGDGMTTKADIINEAYSLMRISGITVVPSGVEITLALGRLESMAAEFHGRNIKTDYNFENTPATGSLHNLERKYWFAYETNLAVRLLADFGKQVPPALLAMQRSSFAYLSASTALIRSVQYPSRMPIGEANTARTFAWRGFNVPIAETPLSSATIVMYISDIQSFSESFAAYLNAGETISAYVITADTGLTVSADANATPLINYTVTATGLSDGGSVSLLEVKIVITTSDGRQLTRIKNFELVTSDVID